MPPGRKPKPAGEAVNRNRKEHPYREAPGEGWQHGDVPAPPDGMLPESVNAWEGWFGAWWASWWSPADVPTLRIILSDFDQVLRGKAELSKIQSLLDRYGITPKGRVDLRWAEPKKAKPEVEKPVGTVHRLKVIDKSG